VTRRRLDTILVFLAVLFLLVGVTYGDPLSFDGRIMYQVARAIAHGRLHLVIGEPPFFIHPVRGQVGQYPYSHYGIGVSLVILPLYGLARAFHASPGHTNLIVLWTNPLITAAAAAVLYRVGLALSWTRRLAVLVALAFGLLTMMTQDSTELLSEPGVDLGIGVLLLGLLRWRDGKSGSGMLAGAGIGIAMLFRDDSLLLVAPAVLAVIFLVSRPRVLPQVRQQGIGFLVALAPIAVWTAYYSHLSSGSWFPHSYGGKFDSPFWTGFYGQLIGPNKGFFFYNPWLVLAIPGVWLLSRREPVITAVLVWLFVVRVLFYAKWNYWFGGVAWGPRFLVPAILPTCVLAGETLRAIPRLASTRRLVLATLVTAVLMAWSGLVTVASVWVSYADDNKSLSAASQSSWWLAVTHLGGRPALYYFENSPSPLGITLLAVAAICVVIMLRRPRREILRHPLGRPVMASSVPRS
jgi:hypothetical protein